MKNLSCHNPTELCFCLQQPAFQKHGNLHLNGTTLTGFNLSGWSAGQTGVVLVDEDTGLFHNRGKFNRHPNPVRYGPLDNQKGKPEESSKLVDDNITMDKKADSLFPGKTCDSIIDPNVKSDSKKSSLGIFELSGIFTDGVTSEGLNIWTEATDEASKLAFPETHLMVSGPSGEALPPSWRSVTSDHKAERVTKLVDKDDSHWQTIESKHGHLVQGSDGRMYRLLRGPPGLMGPSGKDVSLSLIFSIQVLTLSTTLSTAFR